MSESISFRFYVSEDGEVLSNTDFPVHSPLLLLPEPYRMPPIECAAVSELEMDRFRVKHKLFRAVTVSCRNGLFEHRDGIIYPRRQPEEEQE